MATQHFSKQVGAAAAQISATSILARKGIQIKAAHGNTGTIFVGKTSAVTAGAPGTTDTTNGFPLRADETFFVPPNWNDPADLNATGVYLIADAAAQGYYVVILD